MAKDTVHPRGLLVEPHVDRTQSPAPSQQQRQQEISARNGVEWRRVVRAPCPHCGKLGW